MSPEATSAPFPHWMLREIFEQPETLRATLDRYLDGTHFREAACAEARRWLKASSREIVIVASGSSRHAGMVAELLLEDLSGMAVDVEYASEYTYRSERSLKDASLLFVSQSGETVDTLAALRKAIRMEHPTLAISNVPESSLAREATVSFPTEAGRERAVPATKSFTAQLVNLYLLALLAAEARGTLEGEGLLNRLQSLAALPELVASQLEGWKAAMEPIARHLGQARSFLFLGRGIHYPIAREGALKLKESAYIHAEGYPSGELKHGPNALVSDATPLVMLATVDRTDAESVERHEKVVQLMRDMRAQGATILAICNAGDAEVIGLATYSVQVIEAQEPLMAICEVIPLQMLSYFVAVQAGIDVDHPRNLSKAVLAE